MLQQGGRAALCRPPGLAGAALLALGTSLLLLGGLRLGGRYAARQLLQGLLVKGAKHGGHWLATGGQPRTTVPVRVRRSAGLRLCLLLLLLLLGLLLRRRTRGQPRVFPLLLLLGWLLGRRRLRRALQYAGGLLHGCRAASLAVLTLLPRQLL